MAFFDGSQLRQRWTPDADPNWNDSVPYGGKVYLARRKKPDPLYVKIIEGLVILGTVFAIYYCYYYFANVQFHITHGYAHLGYAEAQHQVGQRYLHGNGIEHHKEKAMQWFRKAADQGHAHAKYNLAIGHLKGYQTDVKKGEVHHLMHGAAKGGVKEAAEMLDGYCSAGACD